MRKAALFCSLSFFLSFSFIFAQDNPPIGISKQGPSLDLKLENIVIAENKIDGKITAKNISDKSVNNVAFSYTLWEGLKIEKRMIEGKTRDVFVDRSVILAGTKDNNIFSLLPGEEKSSSFSLPYSSNLPSAEYRLVGRAIGISPGSIFGEISQNIQLKGSGNFLKINFNTCRVLRGDKEYFVRAGPNFYPGEKPKVSCEVLNPTSNNISAVAQFDISVFSVFDSLQYSPVRKTGESIVFPAKSVKKFSFEINSPQEPQVYEAALRFVDAGNQAVSPFVFFRWIIAGPSARIESITPDKAFYQKGDTAKVKVDFFGSMDLFWRNLADSPITSGVPQELLSGTTLQKPVLALQIKDANGNLCGQTEQLISDKIDQAGLQTKKFAVRVERVCPDPKFSVSFKEADKVLTSLDYQTISSVAEKQAVKQAVPGTKKTTYLIAGLIVLTLLLVLLIKKRIFSFPALLILILSATILSLSMIGRPNVLADSGEDQYISVPWGQARSIGPEGTGYLATISGAGEHGIWFIHHHYPVQSYWNPGAPVGFSFYVQGDSQAISGCGNYLWDTNFIQFLIRSDVYLNEGLSGSYFYEIQMPNGETPSAPINQTHNFGVLPNGDYRIKTIAKNIARVGAESIPYGRTEGLAAYVPPYVLTSFHSGDWCFVPGPCNNTDENFSWTNSMQVIRRSSFRVIGQPALSFSASSYSITQGQSSTLSWSSQNADSCTASGAWSGSKPTSGSESVSPSQTSTYTLTCSGPNGSVSQSATMTFTGPFCGNGICEAGESYANCPSDCKPQCSDGIDNDGDGKIDYPNDYGCSSANDNNEADNPQCSDNVDNDADGKIDYPNDPGCSSGADNDEYNAPQCSDGLDNDGDGKVDYPQDPGCSSVSDNDERNACSDGIDNDNDGKIDYPADSGCSSAQDNDERKALFQEF